MRSQPTRPRRRSRAPAPGQRLADIGCGTGEDARLLATTVGPTGSIVAIDPSEAMLAEARRDGGRNLPVEYVAADATDLRLDDASVDGCRCERVLQHLDDPESAVREMARVTRPGGRVVVLDTDWGMHAIHGADPELTQAVLQAWPAMFPNAWSGRRLRSLFRGAGLPEPALRVESFTRTDRHITDVLPFGAMAGIAQQAGAVSADDAAMWLAQLVAAATRGDFFWAATMFAVGATRG